MKNLKFVMVGLFILAVPGYSQYDTATVNRLLEVVMKTLLEINNITDLNLGALPNVPDLNTTIAALMNLKEMAIIITRNNEEIVEQINVSREAVKNASAEESNLKYELDASLEKKKRIETNIINALKYQQQIEELNRHLTDAKNNRPKDDIFSLVLQLSTISESIKNELHFWEFLMESLNQYKTAISADLNKTEEERNIISARSQELFDVRNALAAAEKTKQELLDNKTLLDNKRRSSINIIIPYINKAIEHLEYGHVLNPDRTEHMKSLLNRAREILKDYTG